jgi:hypothetical protein
VHFSFAVSNLVCSLLIEFARGGARPRRDEYALSSLHRLTCPLEVPDSPDPGVRRTDWLWTIFPRMSAGRYTHTTSSIISIPGAIILYPVEGPPYPILGTLWTSGTFSLDTLYPIFSTVPFGWTIYFSCLIGPGRHFSWKLGAKAFNPFFAFICSLGHHSPLFGQQDLKDFVRSAGEVTYADVDRNGRGYVSFPSLI